MDFTTFKNRYKNKPLFMSKDAVKEDPDRQNMRNQLRRWQSRGLIIKLRRGAYILNKDDRAVTPSVAFIANQIYGPSYVSLEYALSFYGLIPERTYDVTSITTKKTARFSNELGVFAYRHLAPKAFRGFRMEKGADGLGFLIAEPEKAVVDFSYLNMRVFKEDYKEVFSRSYRFQNIGKLNRGKIEEFAKLYSSRKLERITKAFDELMQEDARS